MSTCTVAIGSSVSEVPHGGACIDAAQCAAGLFCRDDVCCHSLAVDDPEELGLLTEHP